VDAAVAIIAGLVGGSIAALITTLLTISHEREKQLRERMITAADDFGTGVFQAIIGLRDAKGAALHHGRRDQSGQLWITDEGGRRYPAVADAFEAANRLVDAAHARYPRIQLLFDVGTRAETAAQACVIHMQAAIINLQAFPFPNFPAHEKSFNSLHEWQEKFAMRAADAIRGKPWYERLRPVDRRTQEAQPENEAKND
jgi:hypothetical protein